MDPKQVEQLWANLLATLRRHPRMNQIGESKSLQLLVSGVSYRPNLSLEKTTVTCTVLGGQQHHLYMRADDRQAGFALKESDGNPMTAEAAAKQILSWTDEAAHQPNPSLSREQIR